MAARVQLARRGLRAFRHAHDDDIAVVGRTAQPLADLGLFLILIPARRRFPARCCEIGFDRGVGRQSYRRAEFLVGLSSERSRHQPPARLL
jgi:hypothetical protein